MPGSLPWCEKKVRSSAVKFLRNHLRDGVWILIWLLEHQRRARPCTWEYFLLIPFRPKNVDGEVDGNSPLRTEPETICSTSSYSCRCLRCCYLYFSTLFINMEYIFFLNIKFNLNIIVLGYEWEKSAARRSRRGKAHEERREIKIKHKRHFSGAFICQAVNVLCLCECGFYSIFDCIIVQLSREERRWRRNVEN